MVKTLAVIEENPNYPSLDIRSPDGEQYKVCLRPLIKPNTSQPRITVGRCEDNDIVLADRYKMVSRWQCVLEFGNGRWWVVDEGSANGTFVRPSYSNSEIDVRSEETIPLKNGDEILILGNWTESDQPVFWRLIFCDRDETIRVARLQLPADIEYNLLRQQLVRVTPRSQDEIRLRPQERDLIHYMAQQNQEKGQPVVCEYDKLIAGVWGDRFGHSNNEVNRLVWSIRSKMEPDAGEPRFLKTVKGKGYLLDIKILT